MSGSSSGSYVTLDALEPEGGSIAEWSVEAGDFMAIAQAYNQRLLNPTDNKVHALSEHAPRPRRGRGRPKGSKNKKAVRRAAEVEQARDAGTYVEPERRRPGRPKGSNDSKPRKRRSDELHQARTEKQGRRPIES